MTDEIKATELLKIVFNKPKTTAKWDAIDKIEEYMITRPREYGELAERGTPGMYSRELFMPEGMLLTSRIHKTCHQFIISEGAVTVYNTVTDMDELLQAPYHGITYPGTRRCLYIHEGTRWTTFHPTSRITPDFFNLNDEEKQLIFDSVMGDIIQDYYNPLIVDFNEGIFI